MIVVKNVSKKYGGDTVLDRISVRFERGKIHGLVGRNGSGKTVLLKLIAGLVPATSGTITVSGKQIGKDIEMPESLGAIIETPGFLPNYSGYRNLKFLADIKGVAGERQIRAAMKRVGLDPDSRKWVSNYSLGMRQRLGIAQAIMEEPKLLILDEPMNGLDSQGVEDMRDLFEQLREGGRTILLATHDLYDVENLCDRIYEMNGGVISPGRQ